MHLIQEHGIPTSYLEIKSETEKLGFNMPSEILVCALLKTLAATKPNCKFLELGTGTGLSTAWILDGLQGNSTLTSIDNDPELLEVAKKYLTSNPRLRLICVDAEEWLNENKEQKYDFIFADTWHGKYFSLEETLQMLKPGAIYFIDDMLPQENWPEGHEAKANNLIKNLNDRQDLVISNLGWASGVLIATKI